MTKTGVEPGVVELSKDLIAIPTTASHSRESQCVALLEPRLQALGFQTTTVELEPGRVNLIAHRPGRTREDLVLSGHLDVVPAVQEDWSGHPYEPRIDAGRLYGRGSSDMKCAIAAMVVAAQLTAGPTRTRGLRLVFTAAEETGCHGAREIIRVLSPGDQVWSGLLVGEPTSNRVCLGHRGALFLEAQCEGVPVHASTPDLGVNAIYRAVDAIQSLRRYAFDQPPHPLLGKPTLSVGTIRGGTNVNTVPGSARFEIDVRLTPSAANDDFVDGLGRYLGETVRLRSAMAVPALATDPATPFVQCVASVVAKETGVQPAYGATPFFCDAAVLAPHFDAPAVIVGPGEPGQAHQTDEWCSIEKLTEATRIYAALIRAWCE